MRPRGTGRLVILFVAVALLFSGIVIRASTEAAPGARSAALYEPESGTFIYKKNANERLSMASTTKIMTALIAARSLPLSLTVTVPRDAVGVEGSSAYLKEGERITVEGLLHALLLASANDAAVALAYAVAGSVEGFALMMNDCAEELGLTDTRFVNPHGLDHEEHYTTAEELAKIAAAALDDPTVARIVRTRRATVTTSDGERHFLNHNKLLYLYDGAVGVKTGFTRHSGRCLVGAAERDGVRLISVTLDAPDDWNDHKRLFDLGFSLYESRVIAKRGDFHYSLPVIDSEIGEISVSLGSDVRAVLKKADGEVRADVRLSRYLAAPVELGERVGEVVFTLDGRQIARADIVARSEAPRVRKKNLIEKIKDFFTGKA